MNEQIILTADLLNKRYQICSLGIHNDEFFYHFLYPPKIKKEVYNYSTQSIIGRPCHISYHKDGKVHLTLKKTKRFISEGQSEDESFLPKNSSLITPLLIHSIIHDDGIYLLKQDDEKKRKRIHLNNLPNNFSIILFLSPEHKNINEILNEITLDISPPNSEKKAIQDLFLLYNGFFTGKIIAWEGWAINILITDLCLQIPSNQFPEPFFHAFAYLDLFLPLKALLLQRIAQLSKAYCITPDIGNVW